MPVCCITKCGARKNEHQPLLSLHRFPKNEELRKRWIEAIGEENINYRHKLWYICSLHFKQTCFNRTLDVMRLHDNSVPSIFLGSNKRKQTESLVFSEHINLKKLGVSGTSSVLPSLPTPHKTFKTVHNEIVQTRKMMVLKEKYIKQQKKIKLLHEMVRKRDIKISNLKVIIENLRKITSCQRGTASSDKRFGRNKRLIKKIIIIKKLKNPH